MNAALKKGGIFFCRGNVMPPDYEDQLDRIIDTWAFAPNRPFRLFSYLEVALYFHCADELGYLDYPTARETIRQYHEEGKISDADYNDIRPLISMPEGTKFQAMFHSTNLKYQYDWLGSPQWRSIELHMSLRRICRFTNS